MKASTVFIGLGAAYIVKEIIVSAAESVINNISYIRGHIVLDWSKSSQNIVGVKLPILITNQNQFTLDFKNFRGQIWYGEQPKGVMLSTIQIPVFEPIEQGATGAIDLMFEVNFSSLLNNTVTGVIQGTLPLTTVLTLYGYLNIGSTSLTGDIEIPINLPIDLLNFA